MFIRSALLLCLAVFSTGCLSLGGVQRADTLGKGNFEIGVEPGSIGVFTKAAAAVLPTIDFSGRYGVSEGVDLGIRLGSTGAELQSKFLLTDPRSRTFAASIAPTFGGFFLGSINYAALNVPVLLGIKIGQHELTFGPRVVTQFLFGASGGAAAGAVVVMPGASVGFAVQFGEIFTLLPEVTVVVPVVGAYASSGSTTTAGGANAIVPIAQFKLGFQFGSRKRFHQDFDVIESREQLSPQSVPSGSQPLTPPPPPPPVQPGA